MPDDENHENDSDDSFLRALASAPEKDVPQSADTSATDPEGAPRRIAAFTILERLGAGGMGVVYRARDERLGRVVALKVLSPELERNPERRRRFEAEARSAAAITHPNVATVYEVGEAEGRIYIAMELVDGETLRRFALRGKISVATCEHIARQILRGLERAHAKGIIHRDLKPDNVMIDGEGNAKILDFGLAKIDTGAEQAEHATELGRVVGTPAYMSPEQARGAAVDLRTDLFSFGVILYELLTGARPFKGASSADVIASIIRDKPASVRSQNPDVPEPLAKTVERCLEKSIDARFASASDVLAAMSSQGHARRTRALKALSVLTMGAIGTAAIFTWRARAHSADALVTAAPTALDARSSSEVTDSSLGQSASPLANAAYLASLNAWRDGDPVEQRRQLEAAAAADPSFAAAQLQLAIYWVGVDDDRARVAYRRAFGARASLKNDDSRLLDALEPRFREPPEIAEYARRMKAFAAEHSNDAFIMELAGEIFATAGLTSDADAAFAKTLALDPHYVPALARNIRNVMESDPAKARTLADACIASSPLAVMCLRHRWHIAVDDGRCVDAEADTRRILAIEPSSPQDYGDLAQVMVALREPIDSIVEALHAEAVRVEDPIKRRSEELSGDHYAALLRGDLAGASALMAAAASYAEAHPPESALDPMLEELDVLFEEGDIDAMRAVIKRARAKLRSAESAPLTRTNVILTSFEVHAGTKPRSELVALSGNLVEHWRAKGARGELDFDPFLSWIEAYGYGVEDEHHAADALLALAKIDVDQHALRHADAARVLGKVYALGGRAKEAAPLLDRATHSCHPFNDLLESTRSYYWLGLAREKSGDLVGARVAYGDLLARWGHATPRSVSADKARARLAAIGK